MSEGKQVAKLFARIGFNIKDVDVQRVIGNLKKIETQLKELINDAAGFANSLAMLSKSTNLSPEILQKFKKLGIDAGIGADAMQNILNVATELSSKSFFGFTNTLSQWGIYLRRADSAADVFFKIMRGAAGKEFQIQKELFAAAGISVGEGRALLEALSKYGFNKNNSFEIDKKTINTLRDIKIISDQINYNFSQFKNAFIGQQGDAIKETFKRTQFIYDKIQKIILKITGTQIFKSSFGYFFKALPVINTFFDTYKQVSSLWSGKARIIKDIFTTIKWILGASILFKLITFFAGYKGNFFKSIGEFWNNLKDTDPLFKQIGATLTDAFKGGAEILENMIGKDKFENLGFKEFKEDVLNKGFFASLDKWSNILQKKFVNLISSLFKGLKNLISYFYDVLINRAEWLFSQFIRYFRIGWLYVMQDLREEAQGTWLGRILGAPKTEREFNRDLLEILTASEKGISELNDSLDDLVKEDDRNYLREGRNWIEDQIDDLIDKENEENNNMFSINQDRLVSSIKGNNKKEFYNVFTGKTTVFDMPPTNNLGEVKVSDMITKQEGDKNFNINAPQNVKINVNSPEEAAKVTNELKKRTLDTNAVARLMQGMGGW